VRSLESSCGTQRSVTAAQQRTLDEILDIARPSPFIASAHRNPRRQDPDPEEHDDPVRGRTAKLPPLAKPKHPGLAALIGVLTGGIGLAIYFWSLRDLLPVELVGMLIIAASLIGGVEPLDAVNVAAIPAAMLGGSYGYWRAASSNRRLAAPQFADGATGGTRRASA
jgi:hypothetical protein